MKAGVLAGDDGGETDPFDPVGQRIDSGLAEPVERRDVVRSPHPQGLDLSEVLQRAQSGDEDAFRTVYRTLQPGLLRYLRGLVGQDAEDVASEAWAQIARDLGSFRGDQSDFRGWVATIGRHRALDHLRRLRRRPVTALPIDEVPEVAASDDTESRALDSLSTDQAIALIARLPEDQAEAVLLRGVVGLDSVSAGPVLGKRAAAVGTAGHPGMRRL